MRSIESDKRRRDVLDGSYCFDNDAGSGNSFATMLLGYPSYIRRGFTIPALFAQQPYYEAYIQDDWRATDKLTVNVGLRWESGIRPWDANDAVGNLLVTRDAQGALKADLLWAGVNPLPDPATGQVNSPPKQGGFGRSLMKSDMNNFAPRLGLAYQLSNRTVLRAGVGIFFNSTFMQEINDLRSSGLICHSRRSARTQGVRLTSASPIQDRASGVRRRSAAGRRIRAIAPRTHSNGTSWCSIS